MSAIKVKDAEGNFIDIPTIQGEQGNVGPAGLGLPEGGTTGDLIVKNSNTDYDTMWKSLVDLVYPIGSLYFTTNTINPSTLFGGQWEQIKDRFLLACGDKYTNGAIGGEENHTLTIGEMPAHNHDIYVDKNTGLTGQNNFYPLNFIQVASNYVDKNVCSTSGGNQPHNNMPPYLAVNVWKRIS